MHRALLLLALSLLAAILPAQDSRPTRYEWTIDGTKREALVHAPPTAKKVAAPVIFAFHGRGGSMENAARMFRVHELWPEAISVYMQGLPTAGRLTDQEGRRRGWQRTIGAEGDRDVKFFDAVWATLKGDYEVDATRVYATGHSNGGGFTYLLWAARGDLFASVAPSSAVPSREEVPLLKPKPVLHLAGEKDEVVKFAWQKVAIERLLELNRCENTGQPIAPLMTRYAGPNGCSVTTFIHPGGHRLPVEAPAAIVNFFKENLRSSAASKPAATSESLPSSRPR
jgi:polyhydroxybutyrate depolymerase